MAAFHARSNSLPLRPNLFASKIEEQLCRINSSKDASSSKVYSRLSSLQDLHDCVDKLLQLPQTQRTFSLEDNRKVISELTDASLRLLDLCCTAKDALVQAKESVRELQSTIRRKSEIQETEAKKYLASRKTVKKAIKKAVESLKVMQKICLHSSLEIQEQETMATITTLKNVEGVTLSAFESLFSLILGAKRQSNGWALVFKLMHNKKVTCDGEEDKGNQFEKIDALLQYARKSKSLQNELKELDLCIQDLEESLECLYRPLIKNRVSLLNLLNQ